MCVWNSVYVFLKCYLIHLSLTAARGGSPSKFDDPISHFTWESEAPTQTPIESATIQTLVSSQLVSGSESELPRQHVAKGLQTSENQNHCKPSRSVWSTFQPRFNPNKPRIQKNRAEASGGHDKVNSGHKTCLKQTWKTPMKRGWIITAAFGSSRKQSLRQDY